MDFRTEDIFGGFDDEDFNMEYIPMSLSSLEPLDPLRYNKIESLGVLNGGQATKQSLREMEPEEEYDENWAMRGGYDTEFLDNTPYNETIYYPDLSLERSLGSDYYDY